MNAKLRTRAKHTTAVPARRRILSAVAACMLALSSVAAYPNAAYAKPVGEKNPEAKAHAEAVAKDKAPSKKDYSSTAAGNTGNLTTGATDNEWNLGLTYGSDGYSTTALQYENLDVTGDGNGDGVVFRGGNARSGNNPAPNMDNDPNDFASVLPYGTVYIDTDKLSFDPSNADANDKKYFSIDIQDTKNFTWVANDLTYSDRWGNHPDIRVEAYKNDQQPFFRNNIAYIGGLKPYLSATPDGSGGYDITDAYKECLPDNDKAWKPEYQAVTSYQYLNSSLKQPDGTYKEGYVKQVKASDQNLPYLYRFIFYDAATLPDGTLGNVVITTKAIEMEGSVDVPYGAPIGIQAANNIGVAPTYYPVDDEGKPLQTDSVTYKGTTVPLADAKATGASPASGNDIKAYIPSTEYVKIETGNSIKKVTEGWGGAKERTVNVAFGLKLDFDIQVTDGAGNPVKGTISYSANDLDVSSRQSWWGRPINTGTDANDFKYDESLTINSGSQSYAVVPNYDHANATSPTAGMLVGPKSTKDPDFDDRIESMLKITKDPNNAGTGPADGVRFASANSNSFRDKDGTFNDSFHDNKAAAAINIFNANSVKNGYWNVTDGSRNRATGLSQAQYKNNAATIEKLGYEPICIDANGNVSNIGTWKGVYEKGKYDKDKTDAENSKYCLSVWKLIELTGVYNAQAGDGDTFDSGFAVLLDSTGTSMTWTGSNPTDGIMQTRLFDTSMFTRVEQSHGTGGGIYIETYEKADNPADSDDSDETKESTKPVKAEGSVTFGKGEPVTATAVPEKGYRVSVIRVGEVPVGGNPKEGTAYTLVYDKNGNATGIKDKNGVCVNFEEKQNMQPGETDTRVAKVHDDEFGELTFELNSDGTVDVTIPSVATHPHIHADFSADYYFYKIWQGGDQTTELTMTATPTRFEDVVEGEEGSRTSVTYDAEKVTFKVSDDTKYTNDGYVTVLTKEDLGDGSTASKLTKEEKDNKILEDALNNGNTVWRIKYPAEGVDFDDDGTPDWPELPIEEELKGNLPHTKNHVNRNFWFVTETEPTGWTGSYDNSKAEGRGIIDAVYGQWNQASDSAGSTLYRNWDGTRWGYLSVRDNEAAKTLIQTTNEKSNAFMSPQGIGGKIFNKRRAEVYGTKVWKDYDNGFGTRKAVTLHIDSNQPVNGKTEDVLPEQDIPADATGDKLTVVWGNGEEYKGYTYAEDGTTRIPRTVNATVNVLPAYTDKGELITYTVREGEINTKVVEGYTLTSVDPDENYMNKDGDNATPKEEKDKPVTFGYKATNKLDEEEFETDITLKKHIEGLPVTEAQRGQFEFTISADDESKTPVPEVVTRRNGDVIDGNPEVITFGPIKFNYANMVGDDSKALKTKTFTYTVTEQDFTDPKIAKAGPITVTLTLKNEDNGDISITQGPESPSFNNTYKPVTITAEKKWEGGDPDDSQSVKLTLLQLEGTRSGVYNDNGANENPQTIRKSENERSQAEWKDLPRTSASGVNTYAIYEEPVPGYTTSFSANKTWFKITTTENEAWDALANKQPITVQLRQNGVKYQDPIQLDDNKTWKYTYTWDELPVVNETTGVVYLYDYVVVDPVGQTDAVKIAYKETLAAWDRTVDYSPNVTVTVNNTKQYLSVVAEKVWNDNNNEANKRANLTMSLERHNNAGDKLSDGHEEWQYKQSDHSSTGSKTINKTWKQIPVATNGSYNVYWLSETAIPDYYASSVTSDGKVNLSITTDANVVNRWKSYLAADLPVIHVDLLANGVEVESAELAIGNNWSHTWDSKTTIQVDDDGKVGKTIVYDWRVSSDSWPADWEFTTSGFNDQYGESSKGDTPLYKISVTNTLLKDVKVTKKWVGTALQPVEIELMQWKGEGKPSEEAGNNDYTSAVTGDAESKWKSMGAAYRHTFDTTENYTNGSNPVYTFEEVPAYDDKGKPIYYRARELTQGDYFITEYTKDSDGTLVVTNTNTFDAKGSALVQVEKAIDGRNWRDDESYTFEIKAIGTTEEGEPAAPMPRALDDDGKPTDEVVQKATAHSGSAGIATFLPLTLTTDQTSGTWIYEYQISEVVPEEATAVINGETKKYSEATETEQASTIWTYEGMTYSRETHKVKVTFKSSGGGVDAEVEYPDLQDGEHVPTFTNTYNVEQEVTIPISKRVPNYRGETGDAFTFNVEPVSDAPAPKASTAKVEYTTDVLAEGTDTKEIRSPAIPIKLSDLHRIDPTTGLAYGLFIYRITEVNDNNSKFSYDNSETYVRMRVDDKGNGTLEPSYEFFRDALCTQKINDVDSALFTNSLMRTFKVTKRWDGPVMTDATIQVERKMSDNSWKVATDVNGNEAILTFSRASFDSAKEETDGDVKYKEVTQTVTVPVYDSDGTAITYRAHEVAPLESDMFEITTEPALEIGTNGGTNKDDLKVTNEYIAPAPEVQVAAVKELLGRTWLDENVDTYDFQLKATANGSAANATTDAELKKVPMPGRKHGADYAGYAVLASAEPGTAAKRQGSLVSKADEYLALFAPITISVNDLTFNPRTGYFEGDFYYELQEVMPTGEDATPVQGSVNGVTQTVAYIKDGVTYPAGKVHTVHIHARDNLHGGILTYVRYDESTANPLGTQFTPVVTNEYDASATATATVQKTLAGRAWKADDSFTFTMRPIGGAPFRPVEDATLTEDGSALAIEVKDNGTEGTDATRTDMSDSITFRLSDLSKTVGEGKDGDGNTISVDEDNKPIAYSAPVNGSTNVPAGLKYDTFVYVIEEVEPAGATGLLYDKETEYVKYTVIDTGKGTLDVQSAYYEDKECTKLRKDSDGEPLGYAPFTNVELKEVKVKKVWQGVPNSDVTVTLQKVEIAPSDIAEESENRLTEATSVEPAEDTTADEDKKLVSYEGKTFQIARNAFVVKVGDKYYQITNGYFPAEVGGKIYQVPDSGWHTNLDIPHWTFIDQNEWSTVSATTHEFNNEDFETADATVEGSNNTSSQEYTFTGLPMQVTRTENGVAVDKTVVYRVVENTSEQYTTYYAASAETEATDGTKQEQRIFTITNVSNFNEKGTARISTVKELQGRPWKSGDSDDNEEDDGDGDEDEYSVDTGESFAFLLTPIGKGTYYTAAEAQANSKVKAGQLKDPLADLEDGKNINDALLEKSGDSIVTDIPLPGNDQTAHAVAGYEFNLSSQRPATFDAISFQPKDLVRTEDGTWQGDFYYKLTEPIDNDYVALKQGTGEEQLYHAVNGVPYVEAKWVDDDGAAHLLTWKDYAEGKREKDSAGNAVNTTYTYWLDPTTGLAYSSEEHVVHVHVEQSGDQLVTTVSYDGNPAGTAAPVFTNYYDAYGMDFSVVIKHIAGRAWNAASATDDNGNTKLEGDAFRYYFRQVGGAVMDPTAGSDDSFIKLKGGNAGDKAEDFGGVIIDSDTWMTPAVTSASQAVGTGGTGDFADRAIRSGEGVYHLSQLTYNSDTKRYEGKFVHAITEVESYEETDEDGNEHVRWPKVDDLAYDSRTIYMQTEVWDNGDGTLSNRHRYFTEATCSDASEIKGPDGNPYQAYVDANGYPVASGTENAAQVNAAYFANSKIADVPVKKEWVGTPVEDVTVQLWRAKLTGEKTVANLQDSDWEPVATHVFQRGDYNDDGTEKTPGTYVFEGFNKGLPMYDTSGTQYVYRVIEEDTSGAYTKEYALKVDGEDPSYSTDSKSAVFQGAGTLVVRNTTTASNTASVAAVKQLVGRQWLGSDQFQFKLEPLGRATYSEDGKIQYEGAPADPGENDPVVLAKAGNTTAIDTGIPMPAVNTSLDSSTLTDGTSSVTVASKDKAQVGEGEHLARFGAITFKTGDPKCVLTYDPQDYHLQGDYFYKLSEVVPDDAKTNVDGTRTKDGITYTNKVSVVHLKVRENRTNNLQVQVLYDDYKLTTDGKLVLSGQEGSLFTQVFTNHYDASSATSATDEPLVQVWKQKAGGAWKAGENYDFTMQALAGAPFRDAVPAEFEATDDEDNTIEDARTSESVAALLGKGAAAHTSEGAHIVRLTVPEDGDGLTALKKAFPALEFRLSDLTQTVPESNKEEDKVALGNDAILYSDRNTDTNKKDKFVPAGTKYGRFIYAIEEAVPADATRNPDGTYSKDGVQYDPDTEYARITAIDNEDGTIDLVVEYFEDRFCRVRRQSEGAPFTNVATHSVFIQKDWDGVANEDVTVHLERAVITGQDKAETINDLDAYQAPAGNTLVTVGSGANAKHYLVKDEDWQGQATEKGTNGNWAYDYSAWPAGASYVRTFTTSEFATTTQVEHEFTGLPSHDAITNENGKIIYRTFVYRIVESEPKRADDYTKTYVHQVTSGVHTEEEWGGASNPLEVKNTSNYEASGTASIAALKELTGREFKRGDRFSFTLSAKGSYAYYTADEVQSDASHKAGQTKTDTYGKLVVDETVKASMPKPNTNTAVASTAEGTTQRRATFSSITYSMDDLVRDPDTGIWRRDYLYQLTEVIPRNAVAVDANGTELKVTAEGAIGDTGTTLTYKTASENAWLAPAGAEDNANKAFVWFKVPYGTSGYNGITYDGRVHEVRVHLENAGNGTIATTCFYDGESTVAPIFTNTYSSQVMTRGWVIKHINGRAWGDYTAPSFSENSGVYAATDGKLTATNEGEAGGDAFQFTITGIGGAAMHPTTSGLVDNVWTTPVMTAQDNPGPNAAANPGADATKLDTIVLKSDATGATDVAMRTGEGLLTSDALDASGFGSFLYAIDERQGVTYTLPTGENASASYDVAAQGDLDYDDDTIYLLIVAQDNWDGTISYENQYYRDAACTQRIAPSDANTVYLNADDKLVATSGEGIRAVQAAYFENERVLYIPVTKTWNGVPVEDVTLRLEQALVDEGMSEDAANAAYEAGTLDFAQKGYVITLPRAYFLNDDGTVPMYDAANSANNKKEFTDDAGNAFTRTVNEDGTVSLSVSARGFNQGLPMYVRDEGGTQWHAVYRLTEDDTSDAYEPSSTDDFFFDSGSVDMTNTTTATNTANIAAVKQLVGRTWLANDTLDLGLDDYEFKLEPIGKAQYFTQAQATAQNTANHKTKGQPGYVEAGDLKLTGDTLAIDAGAKASMPMPEKDDDRYSTTSGSRAARTSLSHALDNTPIVDAGGKYERLARFGAITYHVSDLEYDPVDRHHQGDFFYKMTEVPKTNGDARGITYSEQVSIVHVRVHENRTDELQVSVNYDDYEFDGTELKRKADGGTLFTPVFTNTYDAHADKAFGVDKYVMGRTWQAGETFDFEVRPMGDAPFVGASYEQVAYLDANGNSTRIGSSPTTGDDVRTREDLLNSGFTVVTSDGGMQARLTVPADKDASSGLDPLTLIFKDLRWKLSDLAWKVGEDGAPDSSDAKGGPITYSANAGEKYAGETVPEGLAYGRFTYAVSEVGQSASDLARDEDTEYVQVTVIDKGDGTLDVSLGVFEDRYGNVKRYKPNTEDPATNVAFVNKLLRSITVEKEWHGELNGGVTLRLQQNTNPHDEAAWTSTGFVHEFTNDDFVRQTELDDEGLPVYKATYTFDNVPSYASAGSADLDLDDLWVCYRVAEDEDRARFDLTGYTEPRVTAESVEAFDGLENKIQTLGIINTNTNNVVSADYAHINVVKELDGRKWLAAGDPHVPDGDSYTFELRPIGKGTYDDNGVLRLGADGLHGDLAKKANGTVNLDVVPMPGNAGVLTTTVTEGSTYVSASQRQKGFEDIPIPSTALNYVNGLWEADFFYELTEKIPDSAELWEVLDESAPNPADRYRQVTNGSEPVTYAQRGSITVPDRHKWVLRGVSYNEESHEVRVHAEYTGVGSVAVTVSYDGKPTGSTVPVFTNTYDASGKSWAHIIKRIDGRAWQDTDRFAFAITNVGGAVMRPTEERTGSTVDTATVTHITLPMQVTHKDIPQDSVVQDRGAAGDGYTAMAMLTGEGTFYLEDLNGQGAGNFVYVISELEVATYDGTIAEDVSKVDDLTYDTRNIYLKYFVTDNHDGTLNVETKYYTNAACTEELTITPTIGGDAFVPQVWISTKDGSVLSEADANSAQTLEDAGNTLQLAAKGWEHVPAAFFENKATKNITVTKVWVDDGNVDGNKRPDSVTFRLYANGDDTGRTAQLQAPASGPSSTWTATFTDVPVYKNGAPITYTVGEDGLSALRNIGYTADRDRAGEGESYTITNTLTGIPEPTEVKVAVEKEWYDPNGKPYAQEQIPTEPITAWVIGRDDDGAVRYATNKDLGPTNGWQATWTGYDLRSGLHYDVYEEAVDGYTASVDPSRYDAASQTYSFTLKNTENRNAQGMDRIEFAKVWDDNDDQDGLRGMETAELRLERRRGSGDWEPVTYGDLAQPIEAAEGVEASDGTVIKRGGEVVSWAGRAARDPVALTLTGADNREAFSIEGLPAATSDLDRQGVAQQDEGDAVAAAADEGDTENVDSGVAEADGEVGGVVAADPLVGDAANPAGESVVADGAGSDDVDAAAAAPVGVLSTATVGDEAVTQQDGEGNEAQPTSLIAKGASLLRSLGRLFVRTAYADEPIQYRVVEYVNGELRAPQGYLTYTVLTDGGVFEVYNVHVPATRSFQVRKVWVDDLAPEDTRPASIKVQLLADGQPFGDVVDIPRDTWTYRWEDLPTYDHGNEIAYTVQETSVPDNYTTSGEVAGPDCYVITNVYNGTITLTATKQWVGEDGEATELPTPGVTLSLMKDGEPVEGGDRRVPTEDGGMTAVWENLPLYENGQKVSYAVSESVDELDGYITYLQSQTAPDAEGNVTLVNKIIAKATEPGTDESERLIKVMYVDHLMGEDGNGGSLVEGEDPVELITVFKVRAADLDPSVLNQVGKKITGAAILPESPETPADEGEETLSAQADVEEPPAEPAPDEPVAPESVEVVVPDEPESEGHAGYEFTGWTINRDKFGDYTMVAHHTKASQVQTIYVDGQSGESWSTEPSAPVHDGMRFVGWKLVVDEAGNQIYIAQYKAITTPGSGSVVERTSTSTVTVPASPAATTTVAAPADPTTVTVVETVESAVPISMLAPATASGSRLFETTAQPLASTGDATSDVTVLLLAACGVMLLAATLRRRA